MPDTTRRWLCRSAFLLLCVVPTCLMSGWAAWAHHARAAAAARQHWETTLLSELGLLARIEHVAQDSPTEVILDGVEFTDPETGRIVAQVRRIHAASAGDRGWLLEIAYPQITAGSLPRLWAPIYDRLRHTRGAVDWSALVVAHHATLQSPTGDQTLSQVECQFGGSGSGATAQLGFWVDGLKMSERARLLISRDRKSQNPETVVSLDTGSTPLPCSLLAHLVPACAQLGPEATLSGRLQLRQTESGWQGDQMAVLLNHVDFHRLVTDSFPHHLLSGIGSITVERADFAGGRLAAAAGSLQIPTGLMSRSLLSAAENWLQWQVAHRRGDESGRVPFHKLALQFHVDAAGLSIRANGEEPHVLAYGEQGPLAADHDQPVPTTNLLRLLVPDSKHQVPATRQTAWLTAVLPVPGITMDGAGDRPPANPPLRLGSTADERSDGQRR